jgi:transcriptional regulator
MTYGAYISSRIARLRLTNVELANILGITQAGVSAKMLGKRAWTLRDLEKINRSLLPGDEIVLPPAEELTRWAEEQARADLVPLLLRRGKSTPPDASSLPVGYHLTSPFGASPRVRADSETLEERRAVVLAALQEGLSQAEIVERVQAAGHDIPRLKTAVRQDVVALRRRRVVDLRAAGLVYEEIAARLEAEGFPASKQCVQRDVAALTGSVVSAPPRLGVDTDNRHMADIGIADNRWVAA